MTTIFVCALLLGAPKEENLNQAQKRLTEQTVSLTFSSHQAGNSGKLAGSHLLVGNDKALLIDAQLTEREAKKLVEMIKGSGKALEAVFVTSDRPEHSQGLGPIKEAFPAAKILAPKAFAKTVGATAHDAPSLPFSGEKLEIVPLQRGKADTAVAVYVPVLQVLVAGDLVWSNAALPEDEAARDKAAWKKRLAKIKSDYQIAQVLPGHGDPGLSSLLDDMEKSLGQ